MSKNKKHKYAKRKRYCFNHISNNGESVVGSESREKLKKSTVPSIGECEKRLSAFENNEDYLSLACQMYDEEYNDPSIKPVIDEIQSILDKYAFGQHDLVDYTGFKECIRGRILSDSSISRVETDPFHLNCTQLGEVLKSYKSWPHYIVVIFADIRRKLRIAFDDENYRKYRLLCSLLSNELSFALDYFMILFNSNQLRYLDDNMGNLNRKELLSRFTMAIQQKKRNVCFKMLGYAQTGILDPGEADYLESLIHFNDSDYQEAIRFAGKLNPSDPDYVKAVHVLLLSYARLGNVDGISNVISKNKHFKIDETMRILIIQEFFLNSDSVGDMTTFEELLELPSSDCLDYYDDIVINIGKCIMQFYNYHKDCVTHPDLINEITKSYHHSLSRCSLALDSACDIFSFSYSSKFFFELLSNGDAKHTEEWLEKLRNMAVRYINDAVNLPEQNKKTIELLLYSISFQQSINDIFSFTNSIDRNIGIISSYYNETHDEQAGLLVLSAYIEESIRDCLNENVKAFVDQYFNPEEYADKMKDSALRKVLSKNARIAFIAAEAMFEKTKEADWGWKDAGMISLAYYRIVELEINERLMIPIITEEQGFIKDGKPSKILELYKKSTENLKDEKTSSGKSISKHYKECWSLNISKIKQQINPKENIKESEGKPEESQEKQITSENTIVIHGLELGGLSFWFDALDKKDMFPEDKDVLSKYLKDKIKVFLKESQDLDKLIKYLNSTLLLKGNREKYRNPPAHTKYLPYETACECREYVIENLTKFVSMLKEPDDYPNQTNNT